MSKDNPNIIFVPRHEDVVLVFKQVWDPQENWTEEYQPNEYHIPEHFDDSLDVKTEIVSRREAEERGASPCPTHLRNMYPPKESLSLDDFKDISDYGTKA